MAAKKKLYGGGLSFLKSQNTNLILLVGGLILLVGIVYMVISMNTKKGTSFTNILGFEGFKSPDAWDPKAEVMVVFHKMEGCPHCVDFQKVWDEVYKTVPEEVKKEKGKTCRMVVVGPGDALEKSSEPVDGYPTLRIYKSPSEFVTFDKQRTPENVRQFILDNS